MFLLLALELGSDVSFSLAIGHLVFDEVGELRFEGRALGWQLGEHFQQVVGELDARRLHGGLPDRVFDLGELPPYVGRGFFQMASCRWYSACSLAVAAGTFSRQRSGAK